jgi:hypothetical protein
MNQSQEHDKAQQETTRMRVQYENVNEHHFLYVQN